MRGALTLAGELLPRLPPDVEADYPIEEKMRVLRVLAKLEVPAAVRAFEAEFQAILKEVRARSNEFEVRYSKGVNYVEMGRWERDIIEKPIGVQCIVMGGNVPVIPEPATYIDGNVRVKWIRKHSEIEVGWSTG
jgi:hypothetical protein